MRRLLLMLALLAAPGSLARADAQSPAQFLSVAGGLGLSSAYSRVHDDRDLIGLGFYAGAEYHVALSDWFTPRAYAGLLLTFPNQTNACRTEDVDCDVSAKIGFIGIKGRLIIPIPYVAPFVEIGIGASVGRIVTTTLRLHESLTGLTYHVPLGLGLSIGRHRQFSIALEYLFHPTEKEFCGQLAIGFVMKLSPAEATVAPDTQP